MIIGIGTDIVEVDRIRRVLERNPRFVDRVFTPAEIGYCASKSNSAQSYAVRFAAKEALMKALGTGWDGVVNWQDIEVLQNTAGKPELHAYGATQELLKSRGVAQIHISLAHEKEYALASVILEDQKA